MKFVMTTNGWLVDKVNESVNEIALQTIKGTLSWIAENGIPLMAEGTLVWGMICILIAISGTGRWMERGVKSLLLSVLLGVAKLAF
jgi:hypothetical protein